MLIRLNARLLMFEDRNQTWAQNFYTLFSMGNFHSKFLRFAMWSNQAEGWLSVFVLHCTIWRFSKPRIARDEKPWTSSCAVDAGMLFIV